LLATSTAFNGNSINAHHIQSDGIAVRFIGKITE